MNKALEYLESLIPEYEKKVMVSAMEKMMKDYQSKTIIEQFRLFIDGSGFHVVQLLKKKVEENPEDWSNDEEMAGWIGLRQCEIIYFWELFRDKFNMEKSIVE